MTVAAPPRTLLELLADLARLTAAARPDPAAVAALRAMIARRCSGREERTP